jgi:hypothetical protein
VNLGDDHDVVRRREADARIEAAERESTDAQQQPSDQQQKQES